MYHGGRILTYSLLGLGFGIAGRSIYLAGYQQVFSIVLGILMLLILFQYFVRKNAMQPAWLRYFYTRIQILMQRFFRSSNPLGFGLLGMANGLLPCGMVYLAIAAALNSTRVEDAVYFMAFFGFGTVPAMFVLTYFGFRVNLNLRQQVRKLFPLMIGLVGILLILRGMNLGIPFISPVMQEASSQPVICH